ncbi:MAG: 4-(cytidine 5'-diphospho)-2-C-methyl-D-erythritol kinase [Clostridia bacterium]|nr:4-(cytidine 5'-diphospho)-2-C-methyl-D-erythritol kinase [Clostridia bacterium]
MKLKAFAKINLTLDIIGILENGFHALRSVMVPVSLCDEIELEISENFEFYCNLPELATNDNLCVRAANLFFEATGIKESVSVRLTKSIPFPAGLGGGSSDAACVLKGLNMLFGEPLDEKALFTLAEKLGSDVPLCLLSKPALCEGRGEVLTPVDGFPELDIVIAIGKDRLSTPKVFREYDKMGLPIENSTKAFLSALKSGNIRDALSKTGNAFEPVTDILSPETKLLREALLSNGANASHLSGSGPSVYGIFTDEISASNAARILNDMGYFAVSCKTVV